MYQPEDNQEIRTTFKSKDGTLNGESWVASELFGPAGTVSGCNNNIYWRAKEAMRERLEERRGKAATDRKADVGENGTAGA